MPFFLIFIIIPFVELAIFGWASDYIGLGTALVLAFLTAIIGGALVRYQGLHTLVSMQQSMRGGQMPLNEIFDGFCLVAAGALLITPGFFTDTIGFLLLVPAIRDLLRVFVKSRTSWSVRSDRFSSGGFESRKRGTPDVIEGEYTNIDEEDGKDT